MFAHRIRMIRQHGGWDSGKWTEWDQLSPLSFATQREYINEMSHLTARKSHRLQRTTNCILSGLQQENRSRHLEFSSGDIALLDSFLIWNMYTVLENHRSN